MNDESNNSLAEIPSHLMNRIPQDTLNKIQQVVDLKSCVDDAVRLYSILKEDVDECVRNVVRGDSKNQFWRRTAFRNVFAWIEGVVYQMKQITVNTAGSLPGTVFSRGEIALLLEESYSLRDSGSVRTRNDRYSKLDANLRLAFRAMAHGFRCDFELEVGDEGWQNFKRAVDVRNRLTHPKLLTDLNVSDSELDVLAKAISWFGNQFSSLSEACKTSIQRITEQSRRSRSLEVQELSEEALATLNHIGNLDSAMQFLDRLSEGESPDSAPTVDFAEARSKLDQVKSALIEQLGS